MPTLSVRKALSLIVDFSDVWFAELYLHRTAMKKWDTCAADAMITAVGGAMIDLHGNQIDYTSTAPVRIDGGLLVAPKNPFTLLQRLRTTLQ